jgi:hypothetical protein
MWEITTSGKSFTDPIRSGFSAIIRAYQRQPSPSAGELEKLQADYDELEVFSAALELFIENKNDLDPAAVLPKAYEPNLGPVIPDIFVLQVGRWQAYFRVDSSSKKAKGIYIRHLNDSITGQLRSILERIR